MNTILGIIPRGHKPPGSTDFNLWYDHSILVYFAIVATIYFSYHIIKKIALTDHKIEVLTLMLLSWVTMWLIWRTDSAVADAVIWVICVLQIICTALPYGLVWSRIENSE